MSLLTISLEVWKLISTKPQPKHKATKQEWNKEWIKFWDVLICFGENWE